MEYKDDDEALLALLAQKEPVSDLSASDVWAHDSLSRAWAAATKEFAAYAKVAPDVPDLLDREQQLLDSPLWYAISPLVKQAEKRCIDAPIAGEDYPYAVPPLSKQAKKQHVEENSAIKDCSADHNELAQSEVPVEENPYVLQDNPDKTEQAMDIEIDGQEDEIEQVEPSLADHKVIEGRSLSSRAFSPVTLPDPPPVENSILLEPSLLNAQTSQEALQNALNAWYAAGYATALYHARQGLA